jgi:cysteinyl-tRNA synthetase
MALRASFAAISLVVVSGLVVVACGGDDPQTTPPGNVPGQDGSIPTKDGGVDAPFKPSGPGLGPGFPEASPWTSFYGTAAEMGDLAKVAATYRIINIDADPGAGNFTNAQIATLKAGGKNRVISYMNVGSCEDYRDYWTNAPGFVSCKANTAAQLGPYEGYPDEVWMDPSSADYQKLIVDYVAPRLVARGVDGFYLDNLELLSHAPDEKNGPCSADCRQGGLDLIRKLREKFPDQLIIMQNGTGDVTRLGVTNAIEFSRLLDGIAHEEVYAPVHDKQAESELLAWKTMALKSREGRPFVILVEDYVGDCQNTKEALAAIDKSLANGFSPYVSDESGEQKVVCYWGRP